MGRVEGIQKDIDRIDRITKFIQNIILAIMSAIVWSIYAILENKADNKILILSAIGVVILIFLIFLWIHKNKKQEELIKKLYEEK